MSEKQSSPTIWDRILNLGGAYGAGWGVSDLLKHNKYIPKHPYIAIPFAAAEAARQAYGIHKSIWDNLPEEEKEFYIRQQQEQQNIQKAKQSKRYGPLSQYSNPHT